MPIPGLSRLLSTGTRVLIECLAARHAAMVARP